jgi:hypothetical protein
LILAAAAAACAACAAAEAPDAAPAREPFSSTYSPTPAPPTLIRGATVFTGTGERVDVVDAAGRWVTPGLIDVHPHLGVFASPGTDALDDGNEATALERRSGVDRGPGGGESLAADRAARPLPGAGSGRQREVT